MIQWLPYILNVLGILLASGGVWAWLAARSSAKAARDSAAIAAQPKLQEATTADWGQLMSYWQNEINALRTANAAEISALRSDSSKLEARILFLENQREDDLNHIANLEQHIWEQLPPPPPQRRSTPPKQ